MTYSRDLVVSTFTLTSNSDRLFNHLIYYLKYCNYVYFNLRVQQNTLYIVFILPNAVAFIITTLKDNEL